MSGEPPPLPLDGLLVVSIEQAVAAPFASRQLADLGARVIKVERPDGGDFARNYDTVANGTSSAFAWLNRGKESITANLKDAEDRGFVEVLIGQADVYIQNLAPGSAERMGLDAASLVGRFDRLVACDLSGYGRGGPYGERKAYDLLIQCEAGLVSVTGSPDAPAKAGISIADIAGGMYAYSGILTALYDRERTGRGTALEVALLDALAEWMGYPAFYGYYSGVDPERTGPAHATIAPYGPFATSSGREINLAIQNHREWRALCADVLDRPSLADDARFVDNAARIAHRAELQEVIGAALSEFGLEELVARLEATDLAFAITRSVRELVDHPQLLARGRWHTVPAPGGPVVALEPPVTVNGRPAAMGGVPALGEHDTSVREWARTVTR